jgi:hypothetical protein
VALALVDGIAGIPVIGWTIAPFISVIGVAAAAAAYFRYVQDDEVGSMTLNPKP